VTVNLDRAKFFAEYPIKMQMIRANFCLQEYDYRGLLGSLGSIIGMLHFEALMKLDWEVIVEIELAEFRWDYSKSPFFYNWLKRELTAMGYDWPDYTHYTLTLEGLICE